MSLPVRETIAAWTFAALALCLPPGQARGEEAKAPQDEALLVKIVLHPAPEPRPALKFRLMPETIDLKPGNAAVMYNKVFLHLNQGRRDNKTSEQIADWLDVPLDKLPRDEVRKTLAAFDSDLDALDLAARRDHCDWQLPLTERDPITLLLPEVQEARQAGRLLAAKARLEIAEGRLDDAIRTLQTGFALGRHVAEGPTLVSGLVGMAICAQMCDQVQTLVEQPGAPNLYWALTWVPRPYVDLRRAIETEAHFIDLALPELRDVDNPRRSPAEWQALLDRLAEKMQGWGEGPRPGWQARLAFTALALKGYPTARDGLVREGRTREQVEAMPVPQVVAVYTMHTYAYYRDELFKWFAVPYPQAAAGIERAERLLAEARSREIVPLASVLLPAVGRVQASSARTDRRIAALRVIEALRMHAAAHDGRLPERMEDLTQVPVPLDPMTGQAFSYKRAGEAAIIESPPPKSLPAQSYGLKYEIRMAR